MAADPIDDGKEGYLHGRRDRPARVAGWRFSFEPADIVNEVMSFGSPTPIESHVSGNEPGGQSGLRGQDSRPWLKIALLCAICSSRSPLDYPTVDVKLDREQAGLSGGGNRSGCHANRMVAATSSSRFVVPNYWPLTRQPASAYQVQVRDPAVPR